MNIFNIHPFLQLLSFGFLSALLLCFLITPLIMKLGFALGIVDLPDERRIHKTVTPRCGGLGVFIAYSLTVSLSVSLLKFPLITSTALEWVQAVIPVSLPLIALGLIDDRWEIKPIFKLLGQIVVGFLAWEMGLNLDQLLGSEMPPLLDAAATIFLYVAAMNAYNLIDGMDGVAAGLAAITSLGLGALNIIIGNVGMAFMCFTFTGACLGFLRYNFHPARVFLGDTGSMYIGFILMSLTLVAQSRVTAAVMMIIPIMTMGVPMIDTGLAIWRRSVRKAMSPDNDSRVSRADKDHLHHRLARKGLTQRRVALLLYGIQAILFAVGLLWVFLQNYRIAIFTIAFFVGSYVVLRYLASLEMSDSGRWIVDGIRKPGRLQIYSGFMPVADVIILTFSMIFLSWLLSHQYPVLSLGKLIRENAASFIGCPLILIWATRFYRLQWSRARALDFLSLGVIVTAGILIGIAISPLPFQHNLRAVVVISIIFLFFSVPPMVLLRAFPRLVQDMLHYYERKKKNRFDISQKNVLIYGAGYGYTLITRAESFDDSERKRSYFLVGLIDDDPYLKGRVVHGHSVLGNLEDIPNLVSLHKITEVLVSTSLSPDHEIRLMEIAEQENLHISQRLLTNKTLRE